MTGHRLLNSSPLTARNPSPKWEFSDRIYLPSRCAQPSSVARWGAGGDIEEHKSAGTRDPKWLPIAQTPSSRQVRMCVDIPKRERVGVRYTELADGHD